MNDTRYTSESRHTTASVDATDVALLKLLRDDARLSMRALARQVGMSPGAVAERITRLESAGVIQGYHADISAPALGYAMEAFVVMRTTAETLEGDIGRFLAIPEIKSVHVVTGGWDLVIEVVVRDHEHLRQVLFGNVWRGTGFQHREILVIFESHARPAGWNVALT